MYSQPDTFDIGVSAYLTPAGSVHCETFRQAVSMAVKNHNNPRDVRLWWENDDASFEGGRRAAQNLVKRKVRLVVGHYASAAAAGALPVYRTAGIPLILPAATSDQLTIGYANAFRICRRDSSMAKYICDMIRHIHSAARVAVVHDDSLHGRSLSGALTALLKESRQLSDRGQGPDAVVFTGSYKNSIRFLREYRASYPGCPLYLTDDAVHPDIEKEAQGFEQDLYIAGYAPGSWYPHAKEIMAEYWNQQQVYPSAYFLETYAAMQIAFAIKEMPPEEMLSMLALKTWQTVLGNIQFVNRENDCCRFAIWRITNEHGLSAVLNLPAYA
ncbi:MAG TPA: ABC transporter substrate-binding protein [Puia sp.]|nr:ABC transporter substrate-binding protein [Puia sp.]